MQLFLYKTSLDTDDQLSKFLTENSFQKEKAASISG